MRRDRGMAFAAMILLMAVMLVLLSVGAEHFMRAQGTLRAHDAADAALHAARGAVRWAQDQPEGTHKRPHELGTISITVDAEAVRAELRGRRVTWHRASGKWSED